MGAFAKTAFAAGKDILGFFGFANGGIMTPMGPLPLRRYASGGVATSPQVAISGEGKHNEAYVPLPDGRSIPVSMRGHGGGNTSIQTNQFNVTVAAGAGGGGAPSTSQANGGSPEQVGAAVAAALKNQITQVMIEQSRVGGVLNSGLT
jgi:hypothetical protein